MSVSFPLPGHADLARLRPVQSLRSSSYDRQGGNMDMVQVFPRKTAVLLEAAGPGCINHIYWTMIGSDPLELRQAVLRMFWDGEAEPSVQVPLGDFFLVAHAVVRPLSSFLVSINPGMGGSYGFNCYFPMPFASSARIEIENQADKPLGGAIGAFWYHVDYELWPEPPPADLGRFHAQWRRENLTRSVDRKRINVQLWEGQNLTDQENYRILELEGHGKLVGLHLMIDNLAGGWYGEGDDMIFIDDGPWPPSIHGTGTEEIFGGGASPTHEYTGLYAGFHLVERPDWSGKQAMYRWLVPDPVYFQKSVRWSVEHGHANNFENDYASVAYWYQTEPHQPFPQLAPADERLPRFSPEFEEARTLFLRLTLDHYRWLQRLSPADRAPLVQTLQDASRHLHEGRYAEASQAAEIFFHELEKRRG